MITETWLIPLLTPFAVCSRLNNGHYNASAHTGSYYIGEQTTMPQTPATTAVHGVSPQQEASNKAFEGAGVCNTHCTENTLTNDAHPVNACMDSDELLSEYSRNAYECYEVTSYELAGLGSLSTAMSNEELPDVPWCMSTQPVTAGNACDDNTLPSISRAKQNAPYYKAGSDGYRYSEQGNVLESFPVPESNDASRMAPSSTLYSVQSREALCNINHSQLALPTDHTLNAIVGDEEAGLGAVGTTNLRNGRQSGNEALHNIKHAVPTDNILTAVLGDSKAESSTSKASHSDNSLQMVIESAPSTAAENDNEYRLDDLTRSIEEASESTPFSSQVVEKAFKKISQSYRSIATAIHDELLQCLVKCVRWKRMTLNYAYSLEDPTRTTLSRMDVASIGDQKLRIRNMPGCPRTTVLECRYLSHCEVLRFYKQISAIVNWCMYNSSKNANGEATIANKAVSDSQAEEPGKKGGVEEDYHKVLTELSYTSASLSRRYAWIVNYISLVCKYAVFLESIIGNMLDLLDEIDAKHTAVENAMQVQIDKLKQKGEYSNKLINGIIRGVYGTTSTIVWAKNTCERLLKLRYKLNTYDSLTTGTRYVANVHKMWTSCEC